MPHDTALPFMLSPFFYARGIRFRSLSWPHDKDLILKIVLPEAIPATRELVAWVQQVMPPAELAQWLMDHPLEMRPEAVAIWEAYLSPPPSAHEAQ